MRELLLQYSARRDVQLVGCGAGVLVALLGALYLFNRQAFKRGEISAENRILKGLINENFSGDTAVAIARDPGPHGL